MVYCIVLTEPQMLFTSWYKLLSKYASSKIVGIDWDTMKFICMYRKPMSVWWFKILIGCEKCFTGQLTLWLYLAWRYNMYRTHESTFETALLHVFAVCFSIFTVIILVKIYKWATQ